MWIPKNMALTRGWRLLEARRLLEKIQYLKVLEKIQYLKAVFRDH